MTTNMNGNMICDLTTGVCGEAADSGMEIIDLTQPKKTVKLYYVTDPICSHCWALEPVLRKFEAEYGEYFEIQTVMGGLLPQWSGFADAANGINGPADVAGHWREVGEHSRMPIDGTLWYSDPVHSSFPPSRVFKVIEQQAGADMANTYLRRAREALFAFNRNIADDAVLIDIVNRIGLNGEAIVKQAATDEAQALLESDFKLAAQLGVRGFPTIIMVNEENQGVKIVGARPLASYVQGLAQVIAGEEIQAKAVPSLAQVLSKEGLLFSKEIEVLYDLEREEVRDFIQRELAGSSYEQKEILGEMYIVKS